MRFPAWLLVGALILACGAAPKKTAESAGPKSAVRAGGALAEVPMQVDFGLPFVTLSFANGATGIFVVDTGFDVNVVDDAFAKQAGLQASAPEKVQQPGGAVDMARIDRFDFTLGALQVSGLTARTAPIKAMSGFVGVPLAGILGHEFLERYVVRLDYKAGKLAVFGKNTDLADQHTRAVAVIIRGGEVLVPFEVRHGLSAAREGILKLDTGSVDSAGFFANFYEAANFETVTPQLATSGVGAGGGNEGRRFSVDELRVLGRSYPRAPVSAVVAAAGTERRPYAGVLGAAVLSGQLLVLDYPRRRILVGTSERRGELPRDRAGLWIVASIGGATVFRAYPETPAARAGVKDGDRLIKINGRATRGLSLAEIVRSTQAPAGSQLELELERDGKPLSVAFPLEDLY